MASGRQRRQQRRRAARVGRDELRHDRVYDCFSRMVTSGCGTWPCSATIPANPPANVARRRGASASTSRTAVALLPLPRVSHVLTFRAACWQSAHRSGCRDGGEPQPLADAALLRGDAQRPAAGGRPDNLLRQLQVLQLLARTVMAAPADGDTPVGDRRFAAQTEPFRGQSETVDGVELHYGVPDAEAHAANVTSS